MGKNDELRTDIAAARALLPHAFGSGRELRKLESHLWDGETVQRLVSGFYSGGNGLLTLTDRRLLFTLDGVLAAKNEDFPLDKISSIQWAGGLIYGSITIFASGNKAVIQNVDKKAGRTFVDTVRDRLQNAAPAAEPGAASSDIAGQIRKLSELHTAGILTDEEYTAKKTELLERL